MELHDFAEQVLFATTLEEKLRSPDNITDERPGTELVTPQAPGRPRELRFKPSGSGKADFPGLPRLERKEERDRLLHFFANHELLATELMALALLRFPEAPPAFRRGVLQTLKDEQEHTRLYLERMRECGMQFGELPVSGYFWRSVATMDSPMDYVAGLSLTFEQANLDFARHFASGFAAVGDAGTARLLEKIYRDEIGHVAYGLKWFRRWKNPQESDWEAFCRQLKFPLSPQRAKGLTLNVEGRRAAGFDPAFVDELNVYAQSRGRTPSVFVFNPFCEGYIAQGMAFTPVKHQAQLARDLANLPQFLCRQDDIVLMEKRPSVEFLSGIKQAGFALPQFVELNRGTGLRPGTSDNSRGAEPGAGAQASFPSLTGRKLGRLRPWAWGPDSMELLEPLFASVTGEERTPHQRFNDSIAKLYSKAWSAVFFRNFLRSRGGIDCPQPSKQGGNANAAPWLCTEEEIGMAADSLGDARAAIAAIRTRGHHKIVVKEALGLAGHNAIRLWEPELLDAQRRWMSNAFQNGRQLLVEPWLERALDFSVQLEMTPQGLKLFGYTGLINDLKGQFMANWAAPNCAKGIPEQVVALLPEPRDVSSRLRCLYEDLFSQLEPELRRLDYLGPLGIDAFVYRTPKGNYRIKPIVEINPRYTMGRLTLELMQQVCPGSCGLFRILNLAMLRAAGCEDFVACAQLLKERFPLRIEGEPVPRIRSGAICLTDPARAQVCLAVFQVSRKMEELEFPSRGVAFRSRLQPGT